MVEVGKLAEGCCDPLLLRYSSCCAKAMSLHVSIFHPATNSVPVYTLGTPLTLEHEMHCVCGFATTSGNFIMLPSPNLILNYQATSWQST